MGELGDSAGRELQGKVVSCDWPWKERVAWPEEAGKGQPPGRWPGNKYPVQGEPD